jgi:hypothetical protein
VNQLDNRASNFYIALYWADFMAQADPAYKVRVTPLSVFTVFVLCSVRCIGRFCSGFVWLDARVRWATATMYEVQNNEQAVTN